MKQLLLLRHAKSSWDDPSLADFDRPLGPRGLKDAPRIGRFLRAAGELPDLVVCSSAVRARQTAKLALEAAGFRKEIRHEERIYEASVDTLLDVVRSLDDGVESAMLVGHNPGFEMLAGALIGGKGHPASVRVPTANVTKVELAVSSWRFAAPGTGTLLWQVVPRIV